MTCRSVDDIKMQFGKCWIYGNIPSELFPKQFPSLTGKLKIKEKWQRTCCTFVLKICRMAFQYWNYIIETIYKNTSVFFPSVCTYVFQWHKINFVTKKSAKLFLHTSQLVFNSQQSCDTTKWRHFNSLQTSEKSKKKKKIQCSLVQLLFSSF